MERLKNVTSNNVKEFYKRMCKHYDAEVIDKEDSELMKAVGFFLDTITVMDKKEFLDNYTTTFWGRIYFCFEPGEGEDEGDLRGQISTLIHELHHVLQFRDDPITMPMDYLTYTDSRALYEAQAWSSGMEFKYLRWGRLKSSICKYYAEKFKNYNGTDNDVLMIESKLKSDYAMLEQGLSISPVIAKAIEILTDLGMWEV